jgi:O-antigen/teichoic acid export membrane protein
LLILLLCLNTEAAAYVGPGLGAGVLGVIVGLIVSVFVAVFAIFWYPIKRLFRKMSKPKENRTNR